MCVCRTRHDLSSCFVSLPSTIPLLLTKCVCVRTPRRIFLPHPHTSPFWPSFPPFPPSPPFDLSLIPPPSPLFFPTHLFLSIPLPLLLSLCRSIFGAELAERGKEACKIEETGCWRRASLSPWLVYASGMIPNTR